MSDEVSYMADDRAETPDQLRDAEAPEGSAEKPAAAPPADEVASPADGTAVQESGVSPEPAGSDPAPPTDSVAGEVTGEADSADTVAPPALDTSSLDSSSLDSGNELDESDEDEEEEQGGDPNAKPVAVAPDQEEPVGPMQWYILKVQSNREKSIADALRRRVKIAGLDAFFGEIIVPTEKRTEFKGGKKKIVNQKLWPGYIVAQMAINDDTWFLVRETPGIGDFTGAAGKPTPLPPQDVDRIVAKPEDEETKQPTLKISFGVGDRVKINEGTFDNFEGEVSTIDEASGRIQVMINIFGRSTPVELEYWQVETL